MKSIVSGNDCKKALDFPKLMESTSNKGYIVLFCSQSEGTVISQGKGLRSIGTYRSDWIPSNFVDFIGSVCLENDK